MADSVVRVKLDPDTRQLLVRLIHAIEKLQPSEHPERQVPATTFEHVLARLDPVIDQLDELLNDGGHEGAARRLIGQALQTPIPVNNTTFAESPDVSSLSDDAEMRLGQVNPY